MARQYFLNARYKINIFTELFFKRKTNLLGERWYIGILRARVTRIRKEATQINS